jgi:predicted dehydrogenase
MAANKKVRVAIVGLGFGAEFIPIYQAHPNAEIAAICRRNRKELDACGDKYKIARRYTDYADLLKDPDIDAVHINSPIPDHAGQSLAALKAGKHVACTVPMATTIDECRQIVAAQRASGKVYMMMETVVYSREYLFAKELYDSGTLGRIQFLRGSHQQDMDGWPDYWPGLPPMHYATHCVSPCLAILGKEAESVVCHGSGRIREALIPKYNSPFAVETATFKIRNSDVVAEVTRSLFDTARQYRESFDVTGSDKSFEWQQIEGEEPVIHTRGQPEPKIPSRSRRRSRTRSICRSCRVAAMAAVIRTSCTTGCWPCSARSRLCPTPRPRRIGPWSASVRMSRRSRAASAWRSQASSRSAVRNLH